MGILSKVSDVKDIFIQFKTIVIKNFQSDGGDEFLTLTKFFTDNCFSHRLSCPYTPEQNGSVERKHQHIVEHAASFMHRAHVPHKNGTYAFDTATFLINRTPILQQPMKIPYHTLFGTNFDLHLLRVFGCLCYPWS